MSNRHKSDRSNTGDLESTLRIPIALVDLHFSSSQPWSPGSNILVDRFFSTFVVGKVGNQRVQCRSSFNLPVFVVLIIPTFI